MACRTTFAFFIASLLQPSADARDRDLSCRMKFDDPNQIFAKATAAGWRRALFITALPLEMAAVRKFTTHVGSCQGRDGNVFELGLFAGSGSDWLVVVGESGAGNHQSHAIVTNACMQFGPFELIAFVGVAATRKIDDAPIGSVVAAEHVYWPYGGKYKDGTHQSRPREYPLNRQLLGFVKKVARDERWHERLIPPYGGVRPNDPQYPKPFPPTAKVAPIVSVESVSADANSSLEEQITSGFQDSTALEMEGYGAMYAAFSEETPCVVIRGISDDRAGKDPTLDRIHQPIAAAHGAAFAYELLDLWGDNRRPPEGSALVTPPVSIILAPDSRPISMPETVSGDVLSGSQTTAETNNKLILVLNFSGDASNFPPEKQQQLLDAIRKITGNSAIEIVGAESGSFHLFVQANEADLAPLRSAKARSILSKEHGADLLGVTTKEDFEAAESDASTLLKASAVVLDWPRILPDGTAIERPELSQLLEVEADEEGHTKAVLGDPGSGKTALLAALAQELKAREIPFLAIKADVLDANIATEEDLQRDLGLSEPPSRLLERLSYRAPTFLLIDQLDALAGYVDLRTGRLSVLLNLIRTLGNRRNIHIVVSARRFEYEHDTRLKTVRAESVVLELPPWSTVLKILEENGIHAAGWPPDAQQVMRSPQSLATLLRLTDASKAEPFAKYQKMLERLWSERILTRQNGNRLSRVAARIAEDMAERETLWLASSRYDDDIADVQVLLAEKILTTRTGSPGSIGFSHQTIFDFALARAFAQQEGRLSAYVRERAMSLFIRPKTWAALTYLRDVEPGAYDTELRAIWAIPNLRLHLRHLIIEFLGQQSAPARSETDILEAALQTDDRRAALLAIVGSRDWFAHLKNTEIARAMTTEAEANVAAAILSRANEFASSDVLMLIERYWLPSKEFDGFTWHVLQNSGTWSESSLAIASTIVDRTDIAPFAFDNMVSTVGAERPLLAIKLVLARLGFLLRKAIARAEERTAARSSDDHDDSGLAGYLNSPWEPIQQIIEPSDGWDSLDALAKSAPAEFVAHIWPWFHEAMEYIKRYKKETESELSFALPYILDFRFQEEGTLDLPEPSLLGGLRAGTEAFAAQSRDAFVTWFDSVQNVNALPLQRLLAHTLSTLPEQYADKALAFLLGDSRRFNLGNVEDYSGTTKRLIEAVAPHWNDDQILDFVRVVVAFAPRPEADRDAKLRQFFYRQIEQIRFELISGLPSDRLPPEADALLNQGERKFGDSKRGATFLGPEWVGPSMSAEEMGKAADKDILNAFRELPDATGWDNPNAWLKGGNVQLSRAFAEFAKTNPERSIEIIRQFTPEAGERAAGYAIDAMAETLDAVLLLPLIKEFDVRGFASEEYRGSVARAVEKLINRKFEIDDAALSVIESWLLPVASDLTSVPTDDAEEADNEQASDNGERKNESILWGLGGSSILPHGNFPILETIALIYLQRKDYTRLLAVLNDHLARPERENVWAALLRLLPYIRADDKSALSNFYRALFAKYPKLATRHEAVILFAQLQWLVPDLVRDILRGWQENPSKYIQQAFGELATLISLMQPDLEWPGEFVEDILSTEPSAASRVGAAFAAVHVWAEIPEKKEAARLIRQLSRNASESTWKAIIDLFRLVNEITPDADWILVLQAIADEIPRQPEFMSTFMIARLQTLLPHEAELVASMAKALVEKWKSGLGDLRTAHASIAPELVDIAITLHRLSPRTREAGLEVFEQLIAINAYSARDTLDQVDNRFRSGEPAPRRRLPPRTIRARRPKQRGAA